APESDKIREVVCPDPHLQFTSRWRRQIGCNREDPPVLDIGLVGCSKRKLPRAAPAAQLYASPLFRLASQCCSLRYTRWFILRALHGLVDRDEIIGPYDRALQEMASVGRQTWAARVLAQLRQRGLLDAGHRFLLHGGAAYADPLARWLGAEQ